MKRCPYCTEDIQSDAIKCKHCGELLNGSKLCTDCGNPLSHEADSCPACGVIQLDPQIKTEEGKYYCKFCNSYTDSPAKKGSGWIEFVLYLTYVVPGIIYSVWRRQGDSDVCPSCKHQNLIPAYLAKSQEQTKTDEVRNEIECPLCAEKILAKAKICKHCGKDV